MLTKSLCSFDVNCERSVYAGSSFLVIRRWNRKLSYVSCGHKKHLFWMTPLVTLLSGHTVENHSCTQYLLTKAFGLPSAKNKNVPNRNIPLLPRVALPFKNKAANVLETGLLNQWASWCYAVESEFCVQKWSLFHKNGHKISRTFLIREATWFWITQNYSKEYATQKVRNFGTTMVY